MKGCKNILWILAGNLVMSLGVAAFIAPTGIICGGATGIGRTIQFWFQIPLSSAVGILNLAALALGLIFLERQVVAGTLLSSMVQPFFLEVLEQLMGGRLWTQDRFLSAVMAGCLTGIGMGLVMRVGASTGGLDIPALIGEKVFHIPLASCVLFLNMTAMLLQVPFSDIEQILYGFVNTALMTVAMNYAMLWGQKQAQAIIITPNYELLRQKLLKKEFGVTLIDIETGMRRERQKALLCAAPVRRTSEIKELTARADPAAFLMIQTGTEIRGRGFTFPKYGAVPQNMTQ